MKRSIPQIISIAFAANPVCAGSIAALRFRSAAADRFTAQSDGTTGPHWLWEDIAPQNSHTEISLAAITAGSYLTFIPSGTAKGDPDYPGVGLFGELQNQSSYGPPLGQAGLRGMKGQITRPVGEFLQRSKDLSNSELSFHTDLTEFRAIEGDQDDKLFDHIGSIDAVLFCDR